MGSVDDGEGEHTRFPCLAWVRSLVAAVVAVLVVVVVVMVLVVLHRPEKISLSSYDYVQAQQLWWISDVANRLTEPAASVEILVILFAYNPSGRGEVQCNVTGITIIDMPYYDFTDMVELKRLLFPSETPRVFSVPPQSWHRDRRSVSITDPLALKRLYDEHQGYSRFRVMVQVDMTLHSNNKVINASYYCWPVYFVYGSPSVPGRGEVACKESADMDYSVSWTKLTSPAPEPAPGVAA